MDREGPQHTGIYSLIDQCNSSLVDLKAAFRLLVWNHLCNYQGSNDVSGGLILGASQLVEEKRRDILSILDQLTKIADSGGSAQMILAASINNYRLEMEAISPKIEIYLLLSEASQRELSLAFNEREMSNKVFQILAGLRLKKYSGFLVTLRVRCIREKCAILDLYSRIISHTYFSYISEVLRERIFDKKEEMLARDFS